MSTPRARASSTTGSTPSITGLPYGQIEGNCANPAPATSRQPPRQHFAAQAVFDDPRQRRIPNPPPARPRRVGHQLLAARDAYLRRAQDVGEGDDDAQGRLIAPVLIAPVLVAGRVGEDLGQGCGVGCG